MPRFQWVFCLRISFDQVGASERVRRYLDAALSGETTVKRQGDTGNEGCLR